MAVSVTIVQLGSLVRAGQTSAQVQVSTKRATDRHDLEAGGGGGRGNVEKEIQGCNRTFQSSNRVGSKNWPRETNSHRFCAIVLHVSAEVPEP